MTIETLSAFLLGCTIANFAMLLTMFAFVVLGHGFIQRLHSRWFKLSQESFDSALYLMLGIYKILIVFFNLVPWIVLQWVK